MCKRLLKDCLSCLYKQIILQNGIDFYLLSSGIIPSGMARLKMNTLLWNNIIIKEPTYFADIHHE